MTLTTHALVGAAAASFFPEAPYLAFAAGFASHFAIDALPHYDYVDFLRSLRWDRAKPFETDIGGKGFARDLGIIGCDALLGFFLTCIAAQLLGVSAEIALVGAGAGVYPDLLQFVYWKARGTRAEEGLAYLQRFHQWIQEGKDRPHWGWRKGLALQALLVALVFAGVKIAQ